MHWNEKERRWTPSYSCDKCNKKFDNHSTWLYHTTNDHRGGKSGGKKGDDTIQLGALRTLFFGKRK